MREALLDKVLLQNAIPLPDIAGRVEEIRHRLEEMVRGMIMQGMDPQKRPRSTGRRCASSKRSPPASRCTPG